MVAALKCKFIKHSTGLGVVKMVRIILPTRAAKKAIELAHHKVQIIYVIGSNFVGHKAVGRLAIVRKMFVGKFAYLKNLKDIFVFHGFRPTGIE